MADRRTPSERYEAIGRELVESEACLAHWQRLQPPEPQPEGDGAE